MRGCAVFSWAVLPSVFAFSAGAPKDNDGVDICSSPPGKPGHGPEFAAGDGSYHIALLDGDQPVCEFEASKTYTVVIFSSTGQPFKGYVLHHNVGVHTVPDNATQHDGANCVTHSSSAPKAAVSIPWTPPSTGEVVFTASVVQAHSTFFGGGAIGTTVVAAGGTVKPECQTVATAYTSMLATSVTTTTAATTEASDEVDTSAFTCRVDAGEGVQIYALGIDNDRVRLGISAPVDGWVSVGVAGDSGMIGGDVVAGGASASGDASHVGAYKLTAKDMAGVTLYNDAKAMTSPEVIKSGGRTYLFFERDLVTDSSTLSMSGTQKMIWAMGSGATLGYHQDRKPVDVDLGSCRASVDTTFATKKQVHGALMWIGWGVLLPTGAAAAASGGERFKKRGPVWGPRLFKAHRALQSLGYVVALIGIIYALSEFSSDGLHGHGVVGIVIMVFATGLVLSGIFRPHPEPRTTARIAFEKFHRNVGPAIAFMGAINCVSGGWLSQDQESSLNAFSSFFIPALITAVLFLIAYVAGKCTGTPPAAEEAQVSVQPNTVGKEA